MEYYAVGKKQGLGQRGNLFAMLLAQEESFRPQTAYAVDVSYHSL